MKKLVYILVTVLLVLTACTGTSRHPQLVAADSLLLTRPDSALTLLRSMSFSSTADRMYHYLLLADACNKCYDTLPSHHMGTDTVLKTKLLSRKMTCINIYSVFRFECPHNPMPCCKVFLRWGISKDKSAICLQTSRSNHVWRLSPVGVVFDVYGAVACCNPAFTCCF